MTEPCAAAPPGVEVPRLSLDVFRALRDLVRACCLYSRENLKLAWERVRANRGASGADKVTIGDFEANLDEVNGVYMAKMHLSTPDFVRERGIGRMAVDASLRLFHNCRLYGDAVFPIMGTGRTPLYGAR